MKSKKQKEQNENSKEKSHFPNLHNQMNLDDMDISERYIIHMQVLLEICYV